MTERDRTTTMKAIVRHAYGAGDGALELRDIEKPQPAGDGILVRICAASVNRVDWYRSTGTPYLTRLPNELFRPKPLVLGTDFAGTVEAVGKDVTEFGPGDEVFGAMRGTFAEYICVPEDGAVVLKPAAVTFEAAAAVPLAALTALQGLRDNGGLQPGDRVLINGASGGVGTFAVQIAKALGAHVTAVCSTRNVDLVRSLGADEVIDYTREDFTRGGQRYDLMFDNAGSRSWSECRRVLNRRATIVLVGGPKTNRLVGPLGHMVKVRLGAQLGSQKAVFFVAKFNKPDMVVLRELLESGKVTPVVERRYALSEIGDALGYMGEGHAQGKIVISL